MWNLSEIMRTAQGGQGMVNLAQQFGLSQSDAERAVQALLPAFSLALQRQTQTATAFASMLGLMNTGNFIPFWADGRAQAPEKAAQKGTVVIDQIFGTPEVSRQVAAHAAVLSGVSTEVLMRMLPLIAAMIMGGLFKTAMETGIVGALRQMSEFLQSASPAETGAKATPAAATHSGPTGDVFAPLLRAMTGGFLTGPGQQGSDAAAAGDVKPADPTVAAIQQLSRMFETGTQVQRQYLESVQKIFDSFVRKPQ